MSCEQTHEVKWFNGRACVGIVHVVDPHVGHKYYIGVGKGYDESDDILYIAAFGSKFPFEAGNLLFGVEEHVKTKDNSVQI